MPTLRNVYCFVCMLSLLVGCSHEDSNQKIVAAISAKIDGAIKRQIEVGSKLTELCQKYRDMEGRWPSSLDMLVNWAKNNKQGDLFDKVVFEKAEFTVVDDKNMKISYTVKDISNGLTYNASVSIAKGADAKKQFDSNAYRFL